MRYKKNIGTLTEEGQKELNEKRVLVIGSGGLGGFVLEGLARMGVKTIGVCDFDVFEDSNLNRQLLATEDVLGEAKTAVALKRIGRIDKTIEVICYNTAFPNEEIDNDIEKYDLVIDCLDSISTRVILEHYCIERNKLLVHGAIGGYYGTVGVISDENRIMEMLIRNIDKDTKSMDKIMGNPYSIVAVMGALQVHIAINVLLGREYLKKGLYYIDIDGFDIQEIKM